MNYQMTGCIGGCDNRINELLLECNRRSINQFFAPSTRAPASSDQLGRSYPFFCSFAFLFVLSLSFFYFFFLLCGTRFNHLSNGLNNSNNNSGTANNFSNTNNNQNNNLNNNNNHNNQNNNQNNYNNQNNNTDDSNGQIKYCPQHPESIMFFRRKKTDGTGFYICSSRDTTGCRYYLSADGDDSGNNNSSSNNNSFNNNSNTYNNNSRSNSSNNSLNMNATCYHCKEVGHFATQCPLKGTLISSSPSTYFSFTNH